MSNARLRTRMKTGDPAEVEQFIEETKDALGDAVMIMDGAEKAMDEARRKYDKAYATALLAAPGPQYQRAARATPDDEVVKAKEEYDIAKRAFHYAERENRSLEK